MKVLKVKLKHQECSEWQMKGCFISWFIRETYIQFTMGSHCIPIRIVTIKQTENTMCWWGCEINENFHMLLVGIKYLTFDCVFEWAPITFINSTLSALGKCHFLAHSVQHMFHPPLPKSSSVAQSCPTLWDPMDCSTPGLPIFFSSILKILEFFSQKQKMRVLNYF